jgi:hypothetical protein
MTMTITTTRTTEKSRTRSTRSTWKAGLLAAGLGMLAITSMLGCSTSSGATTDSVALRAETPLPARAGSVVVDGCVLDPWQRATLAGPGAKRVLQEVILLCLVPRLDGTVGPRDPSAVQHLGALIADLGTDGYRVSLAVAFTDETGQRYDGPQTRSSPIQPGARGSARPSHPRSPRRRASSSTSRTSPTTRGMSSRRSSPRSR